MDFSCDYFLSCSIGSFQRRFSSFWYTLFCAEFSGLKNKKNKVKCISMRVFELKYYSPNLLCYITFIWYLGISELFSSHTFFVLLIKLMTRQRITWVDFKLHLLTFFLRRIGRGAWTGWIFYGTFFTSSGLMRSFMQYLSFRLFESFI